MAGLGAWWQAREADSPQLVEAGQGLRPALAAARQAGAKIVIVDTPPAASPQVAEAVTLADLVLIPVQPSPHDLRAVGSTVEMARKAGKAVVFVINRVKPRARLTGEAAIALSQHGTVAPAMLGDRTVYAASAIDGRTPAEIEPAGPAASEATNLWAYIVTRLNPEPAP
jgi:chromosome partitioning protein